MATRRRATTTAKKGDAGIIAKENKNLNAGGQIPAEPLTPNKTERTESAAALPPQAAPSVITAPRVDKVVVCYNSPCGIIFELNRPDGTIKKIEIAGNAVHLRGKERAGALPVGAFGMTVVDAQDWEAIKVKYGRMKMFNKGTIFSASDRQSAEVMAAERKELRHGREPVDVDHPDKRMGAKRSAPDDDLM